MRLAHRGDHRRFVENTTDALVAACRLPGIDGVEFDVRAASDGEPVVLHDPGLARTFGVRLIARETSSAELQRHGVPHLADVLAALPADAFLDIELKEAPTAAMLDAIDRSRGALLHRAVVSSFETSVLMEVRARRPGWPVWLNKVVLNRYTIGAARAVGAAGVATRFPSVKAASVASARAAGLSVAAWTITEVARRAQFEALGLDAVIVEGDALDP
jgi:glycerophosphoryl diester phosphodiesterase